MPLPTGSPSTTLNEATAPSTGNLPSPECHEPVRHQHLGAQLKAAQAINFAEQVGVYILYSGDRVIYVGRITEPRLGPRLWDHTRDRLTGRWDRFSWFGVRAVADDGALGPVPAGNFAIDMLVATMEALLIEGLEPPQNRRRGDGFNATEFIQTTDPQVERRRAQVFFQRLTGGDQ